MGGQVGRAVRVGWGVWLGWGQPRLPFKRTHTWRGVKTPRPLFPSFLDQLDFMVGKVSSRLSHLLLVPLLVLSLGVRALPLGQPALRVGGRGRVVGVVPEGGGGERLKDRSRTVRVGSR